MATLTPKSIVPFGKYKGQSYALLLHDVPYCHYLIRGTWLKGASRELLEDCFCEPACKGGKVYGNENVWITCTVCDGKTCLSDRPYF